MFALRTRLLIGLCCVLLIPAGTFVLAQPGPSSRFFPETGHTVQGDFLDYWTAHGGLAQQGYPISDELAEQSPTDGKPYTVQYFERAVFERHPENAGTPFAVLLSLLGRAAYEARYPQGAPDQHSSADPGSVLFSQTGKRLGGRFLAYWQSHGGLAQQGYPISDEFQETSTLDGKTYTVQYFERAVFEWHPENAGTPYEVLLSQLGTLAWQAAHGTLVIPFSPGRVQSEIQGSDSYIVWTERSYDANGEAVPGSADIRGLDLHSGQAITITEAPGDQDEPAIAGSTVVWRDPAGILGKDLSTDASFTVTTGSRLVGDLAIAGHWVAWRDGAGTDSRIMLYDLDSGASTVVASVPSGAVDLVHPRLSATYLIWAEGGSTPDPNIQGLPYTIRAYNLTTRQTTAVASGRLPDFYSYPAPALSGHYLVWNGPDLRFADLDTGDVALLYTGEVQGPFIAGEAVVWSQGPGGVRGLRLSDRTPVTLARGVFTPGAYQLAGPWFLWLDPAAQGHYAAARLAALFAAPPPPLPGPPPTAAPTLPPGVSAPTMIATDLSAPPVAAGHSIFYTHASPGGGTGLYAYDPATGATTLLYATVNGIGNIASDGQVVAWEEPAPGFLERIGGYDLATGATFTLLDPTVAVEPFRLPFGVDGHTLYYESTRPGGAGIYERPVTGGPPQLIAPGGTGPVAGSGVLLWQERRELAPPGPNGVPAAVATLHLYHTVASSADTVVATVNNSAGGAGRFRAYQVDGDRVIWTGDADNPDAGIHLYRISTGATELLPSVQPYSPVIRGNRVAWVETAPIPPNGYFGAKINGYDLDAGVEAELLPPQGIPLVLAGLLPQGLAYYTVEPGPETKTLYFLPLAP